MANRRVGGGGGGPVTVSSTLCSKKEGVGREAGAGGAADQREPWRQSGRAEGKVVLKKFSEVASYLAA